MNIFKCLVLLAFIGCNSVKQEDHCNQLYLNASNLLNKYYETDSTMYLIRANESLDSINCEKYKYKSNAVDLKITIYTLNHEYKKGLEFVHSLDSRDFYKPYQKTMFINHFKAIDCRDNRVKDSLYYSTTREIDDYLRSNNDEAALFDLFVIKSKIQDRLTIKREIDSLKSANIYDSLFLDNIITSIYE